MLYDHVLKTIIDQKLKFVVAGEGWITPISKKERKQNKQNAGQKDTSSPAPARLSPRPHKVTATGDNEQSTTKATKEAAGEEASTTPEVVVEEKQSQVEKEVAESAAVEVS